MVLITGATGLVGSHLALHLAENGESVRAIYRSPASLQKAKSLFALYQKESLFDKIEWVHADIIDIPSLYSAFENIDYVYHCAALVSFDPNDEKALRKTNIEGTANIVNFCLQFNIKKLCHVSSIAALGDPKEHEPQITEETEWNPEAVHSDYAISKYGAEMEIWRGQQEGLNVAVVNPGVIIGPGFWDSGSGEIFSNVAKGLPFYTKGSTGFVAVADVVKMLVQLMKGSINGEKFIAISENLTFEESLHEVASALGVKPPSVYARPWLTSIACTIDWMLSAVSKRKRKLTGMMVPSLHTAHHFSNEKAKSALDFHFKPIMATIRETAAFYPKK